ncbi:MAG: hypothetical protein MJD61_16485 [Proteobacteria bacterium]|nr:hypothetical protein [Pseudomonadota bacterium]
MISSSAQSGTIQGVAYGSVFGGMAAVLAGAFMIGHANTKLLRAINLYNAHFMNRHLPQEEKVDFKLFLSHRGAGAAVTRTF